MSDTTLLLRKPTELLRKDHDRVRQLFAQYGSADCADASRKRELFLELSEEILIHTRIEETLFYPALQKVDAGRVREALDDHRGFRALLEELMGMDAGVEGFDAKVELLRKSVDRHARMEETDLFPLAMKLPKKTLQELSAEIDDLRNDLHPRPTAEVHGDVVPFYPTLGMPDDRAPLSSPLSPSIDPRGKESGGYENWGSE